MRHLLCQAATSNRPGGAIRTFVSDRCPSDIYHEHDKGVHAVVDAVLKSGRNDGLGSGAGDRWLVGGHGVAFTSSRRA